MRLRGSLLSQARTLRGLRGRGIEVKPVEKYSWMEAEPRVVNFKHRSLGPKVNLHRSSPYYPMRVTIDGCNSDYTCQCVPLSL